MFRPRENNKFCFLNDNDIKYLSDYNSVMQFVSKNKIIPEKLEAFKHSKSDQANITKLVETINKGDLSDAIYFHPNCQLYTLYLLKEKQITKISDFLTVNLYLVHHTKFL